MRSSLSVNEIQRLTELEPYDLIKAGSDDVLNGLVKIAAQSSGCPMAGISLVGKDRVKFKASYGLSENQVDRKGFFCDYAFQSAEKTMIVTDAEKDERFKDWFQIQPEPRAKFYLGIPLITKSGVNLGTMFVMNHVSPSIDDDLLDTLITLAKSVMARLEIIKDTESTRWQNELTQHLQSVTKTGYWDLDIQSGDVIWSEEVYTIYGVEQDFDRVKDVAIEYYDKTDQRKLEEKLGEAVSRRLQFSETFRFFDEQETPKWVRVSCYPVVDEKGDVSRLRGSIQDVTSIIEKQSFSQYAIEKVGLVTCEVKIKSGSSVRELDFLWSDGLAKIIEVDEMQGQYSWLDFVHQRDIQYVVDAWERFLSGNSRSLDLNFRLLSQSGAIKFVHFTGFPAHANRQGLPTKALGMLNDITTTIQSLQKERQATARLTELQSNIHQHFLVSKTDRNGEIKFANPLFEATLGTNTQEVIGAYHSDLFSPEQRRQDEPSRWEIIEKGEVWSGEIEYTSVDQRKVWLKTFIYPEFDPFGSILGYMWLSYDITAKKEAEGRIKMEQERATFNSQLAAVGEMLAGIGHEIANPLTVLMGNMTIIQRANIKPERRIKAMRSMEKSMLRIQKITKGLHYLAQGSREDEFKTIDIRQILQISFEFCEESLRSQGIELRYEKEGTNFHLHCNDVKVSQMILNLVNNAKDAIAESQVERPWIEIKLIDLGDFCEIQIIDSGPGIPKEIQSKIMESFYTTKPIGKGTGLGLSLVSRFAEEHGGELRLNTEGPNTCFVIRLPKAKEDLLAA